MSLVALMSLVCACVISLVALSCMSSVSRVCASYLWQLCERQRYGSPAPHPSPAARCSARKLPCLSGDFWRWLGGVGDHPIFRPCLQGLASKTSLTAIGVSACGVGVSACGVGCLRVHAIAVFSVCLAHAGALCVWRCRLEKLDELCMGNEHIDTTTHTHTQAREVGRALHGHGADPLGTRGRRDR